ncbi:MAG: division/cell wall cluster transcriptional repressor MraZ [Eubacterium sp.]|nr:division/cell wall cluster transcriptional repressor MraZ [Eubacterium sp.]
MALSMFGEFYHNVDAKGRLSVPAKFRDRLGSTVVVATGPDNCLRIYSVEDWDKFMEGLNEQVDTSSADGRNLFRFFAANASTCDLDSQGRVIISPKLRGYAGITKEVVVIGSGDKAEVWDKKRYEATFASVTENDEAINDLIAQYGLQI